MKLRHSWLLHVALLLMLLAANAGFRPLRFAKIFAHNRKFSTILPFMKVTMKPNTIVDTSVVDEYPVPGRPVVISQDRDTMTAIISITVDSIATERAFAEACDAFNKQVKLSNMKIPGFKDNSALPSYVLFELFSQTKVIDSCVLFLQKEMLAECAKVDIPLAGKGKVHNFHGDRFKPGHPHTFELECDILPFVEYLTLHRYKGLDVTILKTSLHNVFLDKMKADLREKHRLFVPIEEERPLAINDGAIIRLTGYMMDAKGGRGEKLPQINEGKSLKLLMRKENLMDGLYEGLIGAKSGDRRTIKVKFNATSPSNSKQEVQQLAAILDVSIEHVCHTFLPEWNQALADKFKKGLPIQALEQELLRAAEMSDANLEARRNDAIAQSLLRSIKIAKVPNRLVEGHIFSKFQEFILDCKKQGLDDLKIKELSSRESYELFRVQNRETIEEAARIGMAVRDIAARESLTATNDEIDEQLRLLNSPAIDQKDLDIPKLREEIESILTKKKVFDYLAQVTNIKYVDPSLS